MRAHIIYFNYLKPDGSEMSIGGIQTYISNLIPVLNKCGYSVSIYQRATQDFYKLLDNCEVRGVAHPKNICPETAAAILNAAIPYIDMNSDLLIYGCETCVTRQVPCRTIAIQHGISWDVPVNINYSQWKYLKGYVRKALNAWQLCKRVKMVDRLVCVDHNFVNWHKAITPSPLVRHIVIPNFSEIPTERFVKNNSSLHIIFANTIRAFFQR